MRIVFMGTAELACRSLQALWEGQRPESVEDQHPRTNLELVAVVTQPDRPQGRELKLRPSPIKALALEHGIPVLQPERARNLEFVAELKQLAPELIVVVAYGQILPQALLDLPPYGCINVHTSLLPKYRGAAPIQWAILNGETETGVTIMKMDAGLDTGPILSQETRLIGDEDTGQTLHERLAELGARLLVRTIPKYVSGRITPRPQPAEGASYARKITKEDGQIDWSQPARDVHNRVRAFVPWPGAYTWRVSASAPALLKIWKTRVEEGDSSLQKSSTHQQLVNADRTSALQSGTILHCDSNGIVVACGQGALRLIEVQRQGGRRMSAADYLAGHPFAPGERLGSQNRDGF